MKSNYILKDHYIIQLENDQLKERIKELKLKIKQLEDEKMSKVQPIEGNVPVLRV